MNASDTSTYPMPDTDCPHWCQEDHEPAWQAWLSTALDDRPIPTTDGGFLTGPRTPINEWLSQWDPYHCLPVVRMTLDEDRPVEVDLARTGGPAHLYLNGEGAMTASQARRLAAGLLNAADELDKVTR